VLSLALVIFVIGATVHALRSRHRPVAAWTTLASLLVIGAGFNGASFLNFNYNISSLIMALLAFGAIACYSAALFLVRSPGS
jgi:polyferredoxin